MKKEESNLIDLIFDGMFFILVILGGWLFYMGTFSKPQAPQAYLTYDPMDTACSLQDYELCHKPIGPHVTLEMLDSLAPYPLLAYTTVIAESGWENGKSRIALMANNNIGMMVPLSRFHAATIEDTAAIREKLGLRFKVDYDVYRYNNTPVRNKQGKVMVCFNKKWAIYVSPVDCAKDLAEYQRINIRPQDARSPMAYLHRLRQLNYFTASDEASGYYAHWLGVHKKLREKYPTDNLNAHADCADGSCYPN
jgi:hypothetical protein